MKVTIGQLLSIGTDKLCCPIEQIYEVCNGLTGDSLFTHQLPRAWRVLCPWSQRQFPWLAAVEYAHVTPENVSEFVEALAKKHGREFEIAPLPEGVWQHQDPLEELIRMVGPDKVGVVES